MTGLTIIEEAIRLVQEGQHVTLRANGRSMLPFIIGGRESITLSQTENPSRGDIVLAMVENGRYVIHRIIERKGDDIALMGDGNLSEQEHCRVKDVVARVEYVVDDRGRRHDPYTPIRKQMARLWFRLLPFRRYLLAIYRRI